MDDGDDAENTDKFVVCLSCGAYNRIKVDQKGAKLRCGACKADIKLRNGNLQINDPEGAAVSCSDCKADLAGAPAILVNQNVFCFVHAKKSYKALNAARAKKLKENAKISRDDARAVNLVRDANKSAQNDWLRRRSEHAADNIFSKYKWLWYFGLLVCLILINPVLAIVGGIFALLGWPFIEESFESSRNKIFDSNNLRPQLVPEPASRPTCYLVPVSLEQHPLNNDPQMIGSGYDRMKILVRDNQTCGCCGKRFQKEFLEVHHVCPRVKGGSDCERNLITLCLRCHYAEEWFGHVHSMRKR